MSLKGYWELTIGDFLDCIEGYRRRLQQEQELQDSVNYLLGQYISYAVNDPKKYPKNPFLSKNTKANTDYMLSPEQHELMARAKYGKNGNT